MNSIYLIHAKTDAAKKELLDGGAIPFSSDTFLWDQDPIDAARLVRGKSIMDVEEVSVLDIFVPDKPNGLKYQHPQSKNIESLFEDLHRMAFFYSKKYKDN